MSTNNKAAWKPSLKTWAHSLTKATGDRVLSTGKPEFSLSMKVAENGNKTFTLACGSDAPVVVSAADHGGEGSVRDIADQLCERLAARSGQSAADMQIGEGPARKRVVLNLDAPSVKRAK